MTSYPCRIDGFRFPPAVDSSDEWLIANVQRHGWGIIGVPGDDEGPEFSFTVGLHLRALQPEILIMGVPHAPAGRVLNSIGDFLLTGGNIEPGRRYSGFVDRLEVIFRPIARRHYDHYLGSALWFYREHAADLPALQCLWPDSKGVFPDEPAFEDRFASLPCDLSP